MVCWFSLHTWCLCVSTLKVHKVDVNRALHTGCRMHLCHYHWESPASAIIPVLVSGYHRSLHSVVGAHKRYIWSAWVHFLQHNFCWCWFRVFIANLLFLALLAALWGTFQFIQMHYGSNFYVFLLTVSPRSRTATNQTI